MDFRSITAQETHPLRQKILRPHQPIEQMVFPFDHRKESHHIGAFLDQQLVGIVSLYAEDQRHKISQDHWRLRGMAIDSNQQGQGIGKQLVLKSIDYAREQKGSLLWCNARTTAIGFYTRLGFKTVGPEFEIENIGPHYVAEYLLF